MLPSLRQLYTHRNHVDGSAELPSLQSGQPGAAVASIKLGAGESHGTKSSVLETTSELRQYLVDHTLVVQQFREQATEDRREVLR